MLLAYLLLFPDIGSDFLEELADWNAPSSEQNNFLALLSEALTAAPDLSAEQLKEHLTLTGQSQIYDALSAELEMLHRKQILPYEAKEDLARLIKGMRKKSLRAELRRLADRIADADAEEAARLWEQYQNLLKEEKGTE